MSEGERGGTAPEQIKDRSFGPSRYVMSAWTSSQSTLEERGEAGLNVSGEGQHLNKKYLQGRYPGLKKRKKRLKQIK